MPYARDLKWWIREIADEIEQAAAAVGTSARRLSDQEVDAVRRRVWARYAQKPTGHLWESMDESSSHQAPRGWARLGTFLSSGRATLIVEESGSHLGYVIEPASDLVKILEECRRFEFLVTDDANDYVVCFNHHDFLVAAGTARRWLENEVGVEPSAES